jgi:hypothetical protein
VFVLDCCICCVFYMPKFYCHIDGVVSDYVLAAHSLALQSRWLLTKYVINGIHKLLWYPYVRCYSMICCQPCYLIYSFDLLYFNAVHNSGGTWFEFYAMLPPIVTEVLHGLPQSCPMDAKILPGNSSYLHLLCPYVLTIHHHMYISFDAV